MKTKYGLLCLMIASASLWAQTVTTVAGNSTWGLFYAQSVDAAGNIYVADSTKHYVYKIDTLGSTTILAGTGRAGYSGDGALATTAQLNGPIATAVAPDGSLYISDQGNDRIRKISPTGIITTIAGSVGGFTGDGGPATAARINGPGGMVLDAAGNLFFTDALNYRIRKITPAGIITTVAGTGRITASGDHTPPRSMPGSLS